MEKVRDITQLQKEASIVVLKELDHILQGIEGLTLIGGHLCALLIDQELETHFGTKDIDIYIRRAGIKSEHAQTLNEILMVNLYQQDVKSPFRWWRTVQIEGENIEVIVEFLAGGVPTPDGLRRFVSEDIFASIIVGLETAEVGALEVENFHVLSVAGLPAFLVLKANALERRPVEKRPKDAYDIVYCLRNCPKTLDELAEDFFNFLDLQEIQNGVDLLSELFSTIESDGPRQYANSQPQMNADQAKREAFERVSTLIEKIRRLQNL